MLAPLDADNIVRQGLAGGEKYEVGNIFFKFAVNHDDSVYSSDRHAMKVAGISSR